MAIVRDDRPSSSHFTLVANEAARDSRLTLRARGVLLLVLSFKEGWQTSAEAIAARSIEGRDAVRTALAELEQLGYLTRTRRQDRHGQWMTDWHMTDQPPKTDFQSSVEPSAGEPVVLKKTV